MSIQSKEYHRNWREKNPQKWNEYSREYYQRHHDKIQVKRSSQEYRARARDYASRYRKANRSKIAAAHKEWLVKNRDYLRRYRQNYGPRRRALYNSNREAICQHKRELAKRYKARVRAYQRLRRKNNIQFALADRLRATMNRAIRRQFARKSARTFELIGCTPTELRTHIERQFLPGMSWENRHLWHVDHRKPLASFDLTKPEQQREAFHYSNLQPLWATDNHRKGKKTAPLGSSTSVQERPLLQSKPT